MFILLPIEALYLRCLREANRPMTIARARRVSIIQRTAFTQQYSPTIHRLPNQAAYLSQDLHGDWHNVIHFVAG